MSNEEESKVLWFVEVGFEPVSPVDADDVVCDRLMDVLPTAGGVHPSVSGPSSVEPWSVRFCVEAETLKAATSAGVAGFARAVHEGLGVKVRSRWVHVVDEPEFDRRLAEPVVPALVGIAEIAEHLGVSKARARELVSDGRIRRVADLASGPVCLASDLELYAATPRRAGRPRKPAVVEGTVAAQV